MSRLVDPNVKTDKDLDKAAVRCMLTELVIITLPSSLYFCMLKVKQFERKHGYKCLLTT